MEVGRRKPEPCGKRSRGQTAPNLEWLQERAASNLMAPGERPLLHRQQPRTRPVWNGSGLGLSCRTGENPERSRQETQPTTPPIPFGHPSDTLRIPFGYHSDALRTGSWVGAYLPASDAPLPASTFPRPGAAGRAGDGSALRCHTASSVTPPPLLVMARLAKGKSILGEVPPCCALRLPKPSATTRESRSAETCRIITCVS